jgi:uncharacterized protein (TIGR03000 family)
MYSVVMMMALSGGVEVADFGRHGGGYGGCYAGYGGGCFGCHGGYGGYGAGCFGCLGAYRGYGCAGCYGGGSRGWCGGGYSCNGWCGGVFNGMYGGYAPGTPATAPAASPPGKVPAPPQPGVSAAQSPDNRATLVVNLPADAKLTLNGQLTMSTSNRRWFVTPPLQAGREYQYVLRAEVVRTGVPSVVERTVVVRANEESRVSLDFDSADFALR